MPRQVARRAPHLTADPPPLRLLAGASPARPRGTWRRRGRHKLPKAARPAREPTTPRGGMWIWARADWQPNKGTAPSSNAMRLDDMVRPATGPSERNLAATTQQTFASKPPALWAAMNRLCLGWASAM